MKERAEQQVKAHECTRSAATDNARPTLFKLEKGGRGGYVVEWNEVGDATNCWLRLRQDNIWWVGGRVVQM
jgi:hypothetical protein